jgi:hypothetical protein
METTPIPPQILAVARTMRSVFASRIPTDPCQRDVISAYGFAKLVEEQTKAPFEMCSRAVAEIIPEVFADFWETVGVAA